MGSCFQLNQFISNILLAMNNNLSLSVLVNVLERPKEDQGSVMTYLWFGDYWTISRVIFLSFFFT